MSEHIQHHMQYLCDRKRGLSKTALEEDIQAAIQVMIQKGYVDPNYSLCVPVGPGYSMKICFVKEE
ncbi:MAG: hypothetical protein ABFD07_17930 [Methanobacterium sp.]